MVVWETLPLLRLARDEMSLRCENTIIATAFSARLKSNAKRQHLLTLQVSRCCLLALHVSILMILSHFLEPVEPVLLQKVNG